MKYIFLFSSILFFGIFHTTLAHVKWFVDSNEIITTYHNKIPFYYLDSNEVLLWSIITLCLIFIFAILNKIIKEPQRIVLYAKRNRATINRIAEFLLGLFLITVSFIWKLILIPELPITNDFVSFILLCIQILIGTMLIWGKAKRIASILLLALIFTTAVFTNIESLLENCLLIGLAIYIYINNTENIKDIWQENSIAILRISTGISLIVLAFTEKLMYPELSLSFLQNHDWNFMQNVFKLDFFSNNLFVLSVGFAEMIFGILFILGYITRITTILITFFFGLSVSVMLLQYGAWEVEDLPVYSAAIIFIFFGAGKMLSTYKVPFNTLYKK